MVKKLKINTLLFFIHFFKINHYYIIEFNDNSIVFIIIDGFIPI